MNSFELRGKYAKFIRGSGIEIDYYADIRELPFADESH